MRFGEHLVNLFGKAFEDAFGGAEEDARKKQVKVGLVKMTPGGVEPRSPEYGIIISNAVYRLNESSCDP
jgi:hypothetical protein